MNRWLPFALASVLLAPGIPAHAGPLAGAKLEILYFWGALELDGSGATGFATSNVSASLAAGTAFAGTTSTYAPFTAAPPLTNATLAITSNQGGTFTGASPGSVGGAVEFSGTWQVTGFGGVTLLGVPLGLGVPLAIAESQPGGVLVTILGGSWTVGTAAVTGLTSGPTVATAMGSNGLSPGGVGTLVLVAPIKVASNIGGTFPIFGRLTLQYVPEPTTAVLMALGCAGLAWRGLGRGDGRER